MKFTVGRLDILAGQALAPPLFGLPGRAPELFEALYGELNEQLPMRLEDLQIAGGTAYSDFKMTMKSGESFQADIGANGFFVRLSEIADRERFKTLVNTYETTLQNLFPKTVFVDSEFWHGKDYPNGRNIPKTNNDYWVKKIERNIARDKQVNQTLTEEGWTIIRIWSKDLKKNLSEYTEQIFETVQDKSF